MANPAEAFDPSVDRIDRESAARLFRQMWPDAKVERAVAEQLAASVRVAHDAGEACWSVTLSAAFVRLNVGQVETMTLTAKNARFLFQAPLGFAGANAFDVSDSERHYYPAVPVPSGVCTVPATELVSIPIELRASHDAYIRSAASFKRGSPFRKSFSPSVLEHLEATLDMSLPRPSYLAATNPAAGTHLLTWNRAHWNGAITNPFPWSCGNSKKIRTGDRLFLILLGTGERGIVASGCAATGVFQDEENILRVSVAFDTLPDPDAGPIFPYDRLTALNDGLPEPMYWSPRISGTQIPHAVAERLEAAWSRFQAERSPATDEYGQEIVYLEGNPRQVIVNAYERDTEARRKCLEHHGRACVACGMSFEAAYGPDAKDFIHVHHLRPLSAIGEEYEVDPVADLRPVCPNCHAVIHRQVPAFSIEEVRAMWRQRHP